MTRIPPRRLIAAGGVLFLAAGIPPSASAQPAAVSTQNMVLAIPDKEEALVWLSAEATDFIRGMVLLLSPREFEDEDDWGRKKRIQSGLNVRLDGLRLDTSRRWKTVNHGTWQKATVSLVNPEQHLKLRVLLLPPDDNGTRSYRLIASTRLKVTGRQQQWNSGLRLYSVSGEALADISLDTVFELRHEVISSDGRTSLRILPHVRKSDMRLDGFRLQSISHLKGAAIREFGRTIESLLQRRILREGGRLASRINIRIEDKPERFEIPIGCLTIFGLSDKNLGSTNDPGTAVGQ